MKFTVFCDSHPATQDVDRIISFVLARFADKSLAVSYQELGPTRFYLVSQGEEELGRITVISGRWGDSFRITFSAEAAEQVRQEGGIFADDEPEQAGKFKRITDCLDQVIESNLGTLKWWNESRHAGGNVTQATETPAPVGRPPLPARGTPWAEVFTYYHTYKVKYSEIATNMGYDEGTLRTITAGIAQFITTKNM